MGLYSGLKAMHSSSTHALLIAVDMPFVQPTLISYLLSQPLSNALLIPLVEQIPQVLLAVYPRAALPPIEARLREGRRDLRSLLTVYPVRYIEEAQLRTVDPQLRSFVNINTPEEFDLRSSQ
jgi:molybdopterin-guanine dinucleotide biosynthesis protein A